MCAMATFNDDEITFEDLLERPEHPKHELIDGAIYAQCSFVECDRTLA